MSDVRKEVASIICQNDAYDRRKWLAQEAADLATRVPHLDEIPAQAILPLAKLVADGESDVARLAQALDIDKAILDEHLDALCEFKFAEWTGIGYTPTAAGAQAFDAIGQQMVARQLFELRRQLDQLERLSQLGLAS